MQREPALVAELRSAIADSKASPYALAKAAGLDEAAVRKFIGRARSLSLDSAARLADALGLRLVRPAKPRKIGRSKKETLERPDESGPGEGLGSPIDRGIVGPAP